MKVGLFEKIKTVGHWRVNLRPATPLDPQLNFQQCFELVRDNAVSMRGWDYPHVSGRQDDESGSSRVHAYHEHWCDWWGFQEFWRMYKSGQFLSYSALREDTKQDASAGTLSILDAIYTITEFVEFAHRLHNTGPYGDGVGLTIELRNTRGRFLEVGPSRIPFFDRKKTDAETIRLERMLSPAQIRDDHQTIAVDLLLELFDHFGWNPIRDQIVVDQTKFYRRDFY